MTIAAYQGKCPTCGHDHDNEILVSDLVRSQSITHDEWYAKCNKIEKLQKKLKAYKSLLDDALDVSNMSYNVQYVNWIHKDIANLLDEAEG